MKRFLLILLLCAVGRAQSSPASLPIAWVNSVEYGAALLNPSHIINVPASGAGGAWSCRGTNYGPYTADSLGSCSGFQTAINNAESCRTVNLADSVLINHPPTLESCPNGITLPQTIGDISSAFIIINSTTPLPEGETVCAHGIQDNVSASTQPGMRNPGCNGANLSYQLGPTVTTVSGAFTLANGTATNSSSYNDIALMYTIEYTSATALSTAAPDSNGIAPHHFAILNGEFRPQAGLTASANVIQFGTGTETLQSQLPQHIHLAYDYIHGDWADAPVSGGVATGTAIGTNNIGNGISEGCQNCSLAYNYFDKLLHPNTECHGIFLAYGTQIKVVHNWEEGCSIGIFAGGYGSAISIPNYVPAQDIEDRGNRYTYPYSWILAAAAGIIRTINEHGSGTGSGYLVNDVITVQQSGSCNCATGTITSVGAGGTITGVSVTSSTYSNGYSIANNLSVTGGSGTSGTVDILTGYFPNNSTSQGFARKNCHESKVGERVVIDGNICENVDFTGAQGLLLSAKTDNVSSGVAGATGNYGFQTVDFTITNNVFRNSCNGSHIMAGSGSTAGNGGGVAYHPQRFFVQGNLTYGISVSNPGCGSILQSGPQKGWTLAPIFYTWAATITENGTGTAATASLTAAPGLYESDIVIGDEVQISGCTGTAAFNTDPTTYGPLAILGTVSNGLSVVFSNASSGVPPNATDSTCSLTSGQGYPAQLTFSHNSEFIAGIQSTSVAASPYVTLVLTTPYALMSSIDIRNSIFTGGGIYSSSVGEGTILETRSFDSASFQFNHNAFPTRDQYVTCSGHPAGAGGGAACYTEWGGVNNGLPPVTILFPYNSCSTGTNPQATGTSANMGILGAMNISGCAPGTQTSFPFQLTDWHLYRLCHSSDIGCGSLASLFAAGQAYQATDGSDLGFNPSQVDAAQVSILYQCAVSCIGPGPFPDLYLPNTLAPSNSIMAGGLISSSSPSRTARAGK